MKKRSGGFTLAELILVIAIVAILVAVAIPIFSVQLEHAREHRDLTHVEAAYGRVMTAALEDNRSCGFYSDGQWKLTVQLKQTKNGWQISTPVGFDIVSSANAGGSNAGDDWKWVNEPAANGTCDVYYNAVEGYVVLWGGGAGDGPGETEEEEKKIWEPFVPTEDQKEEYAFGGIGTGANWNSLSTSCKKNTAVTPGVTFALDGNTRFFVVLDTYRTNSDNDVTDSKYKDHYVELAWDAPTYTPQDFIDPETGEAVTRPIPVGAIYNAGGGVYYCCIREASETEGKKPTSAKYDETWAMIRKFNQA